MKVKIKTWEAMEKEFGIYDTSDINVQFIFTHDMEHKMPTDRIIDVEIDNKAEGTYDGYIGDRKYAISGGMIEHEVTKETHPEYFL